MTYHYRFNCSEYVLHKEDVPVGPLLQEVSLCFSLESGTLHKHGSKQQVVQWHTNASQKFRATGFAEFANDLCVITGRFPIDEINKCLSTTGYALHLYNGLVSGVIKESKLDYEPQPKITLARPLVKKKPITSFGIR